MMSTTFDSRRCDILESGTAPKASPTSFDLFDSMFPRMLVHASFVSMLDLAVWSIGATFASMNS